MGLGYPGGRIIDNLAKGGNPKAVRFRARKSKRAPINSVLAASEFVWHYLKAQDKEEWQSHLADIAASFQEAVVDMLVKPTVKAAIAYGVSGIVLAGGVAANRPGLRAREDDGEGGCGRGKSLLSSPKFCTDNGAMMTGRLPCSETRTPRRFSA